MRLGRLCGADALTGCAFRRREICARRSAGHPQPQCALLTSAGSPELTPAAEVTDTRILHTGPPMPATCSILYVPLFAGDTSFRRSICIPGSGMVRTTTSRNAARMLKESG